MGSGGPEGQGERGLGARGPGTQGPVLPQHCGRVGMMHPDQAGTRPTQTHRILAWLAGLGVGVQ